MKLSFFKEYGKSLVSVGVAALVAARTALSGDDGISPEEWVQIGIASTGAVLTYVVPVIPQYRWSKSLANAIMAALLALSTVILGGVDLNEIVVVVLAALGVGGVQLAPAVSGNGVEAPAGISDTPPDTHDDFPDPEEFPDGDSLESTDFGDESDFDATQVEDGEH